MILPPQLSGDHPLVGWLNKLRLAIQSGTVTSVIGGTMSVGPNGTAITCGGKGGPPATTGITALFKFATYEADQVTAYKSDGTGKIDGTGGWEAATTNVKKPFLLRHSVTARTVGTTSLTYGTFSTTNQTRVASISGGGTQTEVIVPRYVADDIIVATYVGGEWVDINADGRYWAKAV